MDDVITREMTISLNEFFRLIPIALARYDYRISNDKITFTLADGNATIKPGKESNRTIASLSLPVLHIAFEFKSVPQNSIKSFMDHFSRCYQRGGG